MSFPRYPKYKPSGVEWLGDVPEYWEVKRVGYYFTERREKVSDRDFPPLSVTKNGIVPQLETAAKTDDNDNRKKVCKGDFVINSRSDRNGSAGASNLDGSVSLINIVLRPEEGIHVPFIHHLLRSHPFQQEFYRNGQGIVADLWTTNYSMMRDIRLAMPSSIEQARIAEFLDREAGKIDALITEQRRLIELLKEKRQAVISHAVTRGLNPHDPLKPSGVEWLGEIPNHWTVGALRYFATFSTGSTPSREVEEFWNGPIPWVKTGEINYDTIIETEESITPEGMNSCAVSLAPPGTLLMALYGQGVTRGRVALLGIQATFNQACVGIRAGQRMDPRFLRAFFIFAYPFIRSSGNETTQMNLNVSYVGGIRIPVPPLDEQAAIVEFLDAETSKFDALTAEAERAIELLQERRTALISAAVTGQIDVRDA